MTPFICKSRIGGPREAERIAHAGVGKRMKMLAEGTGFLLEAKKCYDVGCSEGYKYM